MLQPLDHTPVTFTFRFEYYLLGNTWCNDFINLKVINNSGKVTGQLVVSGNIREQHNSSTNFSSQYHSVLSGEFKHRVLPPTFIGSPLGTPLGESGTEELASALWRESKGKAYN